MLVIRPRDRVLLRASVVAMLLQVLVGGLGFALHLGANFGKPADTLLDRFIYDAPIFAPLLFANLAVLAWIGMWAMSRPGKTTEIS